MTAHGVTCPNRRHQTRVALQPETRLINGKCMSTQEKLLEAIKNQPEPVLNELWHYLNFLTRRREEETWADLLPTREVEQEVLDVLDGHEPTAR